MATASNRTAPARNMKLITPAATDLSTVFAGKYPRSLYVTTAGTLSITNQDDSTEATVPFSVGYHPIQPKKITAAGGGCVVYALLD